MFKVPSENRFAICAMLIGTFSVGSLIGILLTDAGEFREWFGASSGWAAAFAAIITLIFLKRTVEQAQESNRILERQTKAVMGELDPVFNYNGKATTDDFEIFRFWNYNRRAITLMSVEIIAPRNICFAHVDIKKTGWEEVKLLLDDDLNAGDYLDSLLKRSRRIDKIVAVAGTSVGETCKPVTFRIQFADTNFNTDVGKPTVELAIHWRFRDHNREIVNTINCTAHIGTWSVDEEEDPILKNA